jgi:V/A-type H+-transporting ATPase subunit K
VKHGVFLWALIFALLIAGSLNIGCALAAEAGAAEGQRTIDFGMIAVGAGIAIGFAGLGAGIGLGTATAGIAGAGAEKPEIIFRLFIYVVFIEAVAIYGLIVSIFVMVMLPGAF